ncbi:hypothetical protein F0U61_35150 [Archangium violaceum]|uniref:RCC1 domain-containing protein n=1 Tax=Archangium violaceum TaxID=83451 RepID=UPI002B2BC9E9|nr:hypothetical protein F0U61_35150 [Archangium violaceum]
MRMSMNAAARGCLGVMLGSALVVGCGGQGENAEQSPSAVGQVERAVTRSVPMQVTALSGVQKVLAGNSNVFAQTSDGKRWGWGYDYFGQVGAASGSSPGGYSVPVELQPSLSTTVGFDGGALHTLFLLNDGSVIRRGLDNFGQVGSFSISGTAIAAGTLHSVVLKSDGTVWGWGDNRNGQLGDGTYASPRYAPVQVTGLSGVTIKAIAAGGDNTYALDSNGDVWAWGSNLGKQLGYVGDFSLVPKKVPALSPAKAIVAGANFVVALKTDGTVWSTGGTNPTWQVMGLPATATITSIAAGQDFAMAVDSVGSVWSWGINLYGQLGHCTNTDSLTTAVRVASSCNGGSPTAYLSNVASVAAASFSGFAVRGDGTLWSWGYDEGVLGTNNQ